MGGYGGPSRGRRQRDRALGSIEARMGGYGGPSRGRCQRDRALGSIEARMGGYGGPSRGPPSKEKVPLRHRQGSYRLAREPLSPRAPPARRPAHPAPRERRGGTHIS